MGTQSGSPQSSRAHLEPRLREFIGHNAAANCVCRHSRWNDELQSSTQAPQQKGLQAELHFRGQSRALVAKRLHEAALVDIRNRGNH